MKLLQISPSPIYPPESGGALRSHGLLSGLEEGDTARRFSQAGLSESPLGGETVQTHPGVYEYKFTSLPQSAVGVLMSNVDWPMIHAPLTLKASRSRLLDRWIDRSDVVMVEHPWQFPYVVEQVESGSLLVYSSHNFEPELYQHLSERTAGSLVYRWIKRIERRAVEESDLVVVTSEHDLQQYQSHYDRNDGWHVARNGVSSNDIVAPNSPRNLSLSSQEELSAIFVGSSHPPNVEAVEYIFRFARELTDTNVHFDIIGTVADAFETEAVPASVTVHGYVETLSDYYREADVALNPITSGSGSNLKLVEYLSGGIPVISTPFGTRGFPFEDGHHLIVTDIDSFVQEIRRAASDQQKLHTLVSRAQELIKQELVWEEISSDLFNTIKNNIDR